MRYMGALIQSKHTASSFYNVRLLLFYFNERNEEKQLLLILAHIQNLRN